MIYLSIILLGVILSLSGILTFIRIFTISKKLLESHSRLESNILDDTYPQVLLFIPVLREERILKKALINFSRLKYPKEKLKIIIVTTQKEFDRSHLGPNSITIAKETIMMLNNVSRAELFMHVHYPYSYGVKSDQLNYAILQLQNRCQDLFSDTTYIGVYDIDSSVPENILRLLARDASSNNFPNVYQQPTTYLKNYLSLGDTVDNLLSRSFALMQTAYSISYESYNFLKQSELLKNKSNNIFRHKMRYCIGHGLFVKWPYLKRLRLFPTPIEDTRLGHVISYLKEDIKILPAFDTVETANGTVNKIMQASTWSWGEAMFLEDFKIAKTIDKVPDTMGIWLAAYNFYRNLIWIGKGPALVLVVGWMIWTGHFILALVTIFLVVYLRISAVIMVSNRLQKLSVGNLYKFRLSDLMLVLCAPIEFTIMSVGPIIGFFRFLFLESFRKQPNLYKTER